MPPAERRRLLIFGAGGFGGEVLQIVRDVEASKPGSWSVAGFMVDDHLATAKTYWDLPVLADDNWLRWRNDVHLIIAVGCPAQRSRIVDRFGWLAEDRFARLVHPTAYLGHVEAIGPGSIVCAGAVLTTAITIGRHVQVHAGATIGHDAKLEDFVSVYPGANIAGHVRLRAGAEIGSGSIILPKLEVGRSSIVGAGTVVNRSVPHGVTVVGNPARVVKSNPIDG